MRKLALLSVPRSAGSPEHRMASGKELELDAAVYAPCLLRMVRVPYSRVIILIGCERSCLASGTFDPVFSHSRVCVGIYDRCDALGRSAGEVLIGCSLCHWRARYHRHTGATL